MLKLCFFVLAVLVSCAYAWLDVTVPQLISSVMEAEHRRSSCNIDKWAFENFNCDSEKAALCIFGEDGGECRTCLFLCLREKSSCKFDAPRVPVHACENAGSEAKCVFTQWSGENGVVECTGPYIQVAMNEIGQIIKADETTLYHMCMIDGCDGCPSNQVYCDYEIPCQRSCGDPEPVCLHRSGCGCRGDQFWNGFECADQCDECPPGVARILCSEDPCAGMKCHKHKEAGCRATTCGQCQAKFYLNGTYISTDECYGVECPPNVTRVACDKDPCKETYCLKYHESEGLECRASTCGGCHPRFYLNGQPLSADDCADGCIKDYWVECETIESKLCPVCTNGCVCYKRTALIGGRNDGRPGTCWLIYDCYLPDNKGLMQRTGSRRPRG